MKSYSLELSAHRPLTDTEDPPRLYFSEPRAWQVSYARQIAEQWDPKLEEMESRKHDLAIQLKRMNIRLDVDAGFKYLRSAEDGEDVEDLDEGVKIASAHASLLDKIFTTRLDRDFDMALVYVSSARHLQLLDEDAPAEWPKLDRREVGPAMDDRRDIGSLLTQKDKLRVIGTYRDLVNKGIDSLTERERDDLKKS